MANIRRKDKIIQDLKERGKDKPYSAAEISELVAEVLELMSSNSSSKLIDIKKTVEVFGFVTRQNKLNKSTLGIGSINGRGDKSITVNKNSDNSSKRIAYAYALGDYLLNYLGSASETEKVLFTSTCRFKDKWEESFSREEHLQALRFAAEILMPEEVLTSKMYNFICFKATNDLTTITEYLAKTFNVEESLVKWRIKELYRSTQEQLIKGKQKQESKADLEEMKGWADQVKEVLLENAIKGVVCSEDYIRKLVKCISSVVNFNNGENLPFNIERAVQDFGLKIVVEEKDKQEIGGILIKKTIVEEEGILIENVTREIIVNKNHDQDEFLYRDMLAYYLGYYLLCYVGNGKEEKERLLDIKSKEELLDIISKKGLLDIISKEELFDIKSKKELLDIISKKELLDIIGKKELLDIIGKEKISLKIISKGTEETFLEKCNQQALRFATEILMSEESFCCKLYYCSKISGDREEILALMSSIFGVTETLLVKRAGELSKEEFDKKARMCATEPA